MSASDRHARLAAVFEDALAAAPEAREARLIEACGGDEGLLAEARELLRHHEARTMAQAGANAPLDRAILEQPMDLRAVFDAALGARSADEAASPQIPGYRVLGVLGEGGMGVVYLAKQDKPRRRVAIKLMRAGAASPAMLKRFDLEQELLGRLQHPGIAQIFGAGVCRPFGESSPRQPYFVMEHVEGLPLTAYCAKHRLDSRDRLRLLLKICDAVQHAHSRGIVHRDLKPGNVMVEGRDEETGRAGDEETERRKVEAKTHDSRPTQSLRLSLSQSLPQIKILDFGVARATDSDIQVTTLHTAVGQIVGTLAYMSPEQAAGDATGVDARSDVYALGVIGYELLSGQLPHTLHGRSLAEAVRILREEEPAPLSLADRVFRGDLNTIFAKALEKDPSRRYASAAELAADVQRFLEDQPIVARPPSTIYNLRKFARRNKGLVAGVALAFAVLAAGVVGTSIGLVKARQAERIATRQAGRAEAVRDFLIEVIASPHPSRMGKDVRMSDLLAIWERELPRAFTIDPDISTEIELQLGAMNAVVLQYEQAERHISRAVERRRELAGANHPDTLQAESRLVELRRASGRLAEAETTGRDLLARCEKHVGPTHRLTVSMHNELGLSLKDLGKQDEAEQLFRTAIERWPQTDDPDREVFMAAAMNNLALVVRERGDNAEAERLYRQAIEIDERVHGRKYYKTLFAINNLAVLLRSEKRLAEAEPLFREVLEARRDLLGDDNEDTLLSMNNLAMTLTSLGRLEEAAPVLRDTYEAHQRVLGPGHNGTQIVTNNYARVLLDLGRAGEAEPIFRANLEAAKQSFPAGHWRIGLYQAGVGESLLRQDRAEEGMALLREARVILAAAVGENDQRTTRVEGVIAAAEAKPMPAATMPE